jgi:hypothetical protein
MKIQKIDLKGYFYVQTFITPGNVKVVSSLQHQQHILKLIRYDMRVDDFF